MVKEPGTMELVFTPKSGEKPQIYKVYEFQSGGVCLSMYNTDEVIFKCVNSRYIYFWKLKKLLSKLKKIFLFE